VLGDTDLVVDAAKSERAYRAALRRKEQIVKVFSDLNHMLQPCTDSSQPPPLIETTIDPRVLGFVKDWLAQQ
jgi:hypothetical protein